MKNLSNPSFLHRSLRMAIFLGCWLVTASGFGQQLRMSNSFIFNPYLANCGSIGGNNLTNFFVSHQQRRMAEGTNWRSLSQFLNFKSQPLGRSGSFAWGANVNNDIEWTEFRLGINVSIAAAIVNTKSMRLSVGVTGGFINWGSRYDKVRVFDRNDVLVSDRGNFAELDAGLGGEYKFWNNFLRADINVFTQQLPGNAISSTLPGLNIYPHVFGGAGILFSPVHNLFIGPRVFYRNIFSHGDTTQLGAPLDVGLKAEFDRQNLWLGGSYRINQGGLTMGFGMRIAQTDTVGLPDLIGYFVDMNASFSLPMGQGAVFGPTFELGLNVAFGRNRKHMYRRDTIRPSTGSFWVDDGHLNDHMVARLKQTAPSGLKGNTLVGSKAVLLTYEWDDNSYQYVGSTPQKANDSLISELGEEWLGTDAILENMVAEVIKEALRPDTNGVSNPEILEKLEGLVYIELACQLLVDEEEANDLAKGMMYEGELGTNNRSKDSLLLKVVYNDADTVIGIGKDRQITNLELACLKLHAMRKKLEYELNTAYGEDWAVYWEGEPLSVGKTQGRKVVYLKKPRITPNHPHQDAFQVNLIRLRFARSDGSSNSQALEDPDGGPKRPKKRKERDKERKPIRDKVY